MTRHIPILLAIIAVVALATLTLRFAQSSDADSADRALAGVEIPPPPSLPRPSGAWCAFEPKDSGDQVSALVVSGRCSGEISQPFSCAAGDETFNGSTRASLAGDNALFLSVILPVFDGPGDYADAMIFGQLAGPDGVSRWSNRQASVTVDDDKAVHIERVDLEAEPGTSTSHVLGLAGTIVCARPPSSDDIASEGRPDR